MAEERELPRNQRIVVSVFIWLIVGPLCFGMFFWAWPLGIASTAVAIWTTWDYIRKGGMAEHVTEGMSRESRVADGAIEMFGREDRHR